MRHGAGLLKLGLKEPQGQLLTVRVGGYIGVGVGNGRWDNSIRVRSLDGDWVLWLTWGNEKCELE